jgi:hypothetical protein
VCNNFKWLINGHLLWLQCWNENHPSTHVWDVVNLRHFPIPTVKLQNLFFLQSGFEACSKANCFNYEFCLLYTFLYETGDLEVLYESTLYVTNNVQIQ